MRSNLAFFVFAVGLPNGKCCRFLLAVGLPKGTERVKSFSILWGKNCFRSFTDFLIEVIRLEFEKGLLGR